MVKDEEVQVQSDSPQDSNNNKQTFNDKIQQILDGEREATLVLDDPAGNSYVQNPNAPADDPNLKKELYERTDEQKDDLGLSMMKVENYQEEEKWESLDTVKEEAENEE